tara:strand:- start:30 stop:506 length:477 start_codon:yes stop_codon:yes gene_type:complete
MAQKKTSDKKIKQLRKNQSADMKKFRKEIQSIHDKHLAKLKKIKPSRGMTAIKKPEYVSKTDWSKLAKKYKEAAKATPMKRVAKKSLGRRLVGKTLAKAIPGAGAAMIVHDVMRAGAKKGCIKRGGEWVGGKCKVAKKSRKKTSGPDPRFSKSRSKKK